MPDIAPEEPQGGADNPEPGWEVAEIVYELKKPLIFGSSRALFWAQATGPTGRYAAAKSDVWLKSDPTHGPDPGPESIAVVDGLMEQLKADGWESTGSESGRWYRHSFRRRITG
jgi:hypothetical protein